MTKYRLKPWSSDSWVIQRKGLIFWHNVKRWSSFFEMSIAYTVTSIEAGREAALQLREDDKEAERRAAENKERLSVMPTVEI